MKWLLILLVGCGTASTTTAHRDTLSTIPRAASAALQREAGGAKIEKVEREGDLYEASWHVDGLEHEAAVTAAGELIEREQEVPAAQVPAVVRAAAIAKLPQSTSIKFVKLMNGNWEAEAEEYEVLITPEGRLVDHGDDDDEDDAD